VATRALLLSTFAKFLNLYPEELGVQITQILKQQATYIDAEIQQRAFEYHGLHLLRDPELMVRCCCCCCCCFSLLTSSILSSPNSKQCWTLCQLLLKLTTLKMTAAIIPMTMTPTLTLGIDQLGISFFSMVNTIC
jgi:hypothetical protein